jgi:hypothetical protein
MRDRFVWLIGPFCAGILLFAAGRVFSRRFEAGLPLARGIPPELFGWLLLGATALVVVGWLLCWRDVDRRRSVARGLAHLPRSSATKAGGKPPRHRRDRTSGGWTRHRPSVNGQNAVVAEASPARLKIDNRSHLMRCFVWSVALNAPFVATGQIWHSYDFSTHVFFASHYQQSWWSLWEPRWFEGFDVASYPPLTHQLTALLGWLTGTETAVNLLTAACIIAFPVILYGLACQYVRVSEAAGVAAVAVVTPSLLLSGYAFGQLPTLFALDASLIAATALTSFLRHGGTLRLATVLAFGGVVVAAHHATMLFFLPPLFGTIIVSEALRANVNRFELAQRAVLAAVGTALATFLVILPFWVWYSTENVTQLPIDHQSRHNFLLDPIAQDQFFWAEHGVLIAGLFVALPLLRRRVRTFAPWYLLALYLVILGLGGTTPFPRLLFGPFWEWLTYDRFSIWADVPLVILLGTTASICLTRDSGEKTALPPDVETPGDRRKARFEGRALPRAMWVLTIALLAVVACADSLLPAMIQSEPIPIDPRPIIAFLGDHGHDASGRASWRYLTLGFGEQAGLLQAQTDVGTVDGYFYTARRLPLLTQSKIASLDFSLLWDPEAKTLRSLLLHPEPDHLRYVFTSEPAYETILVASGWRKNETLENGVGEWETNRVVAPAEPAPLRGGILAIWWGIAPLTALAGGLALSWRRYSTG